jgi:hypothetical protein
MDKVIGGEAERVMNDEVEREMKWACWLPHCPYLKIKTTE